MKKLTILSLLLFAAFHFTKAQSSITNASYNKTSQPALMLELPYDEDVCEDFILANLKKTGYDVETKGRLFWKNSKLNGYYTFKEVRFKELDHTVDLYFKVEQKGRRSKDESIIYMLVGKGENYFIPTSDDEVYGVAKKFMNDFIEQAAAYKLQLDIKAQEEVVKDAEKKMEKLKNTGEKLKDNEGDMNKKISQLQKDIKENQEDQKKNQGDQKDQQKTLDDEKKKLDDLKGQVKKS